MHISLSIYIYIYISLLFASLKFHLKDAKKKEKEEEEEKKLGTKIREGKHEDPHKYQLRGNITHGAPVEKVF